MNSDSVQGRNGGFSSQTDNNMTLVQLFQNTDTSHREEANRGTLVNPPGPSADFNLPSLPQSSTPNFGTSSGMDSMDLTCFGMSSAHEKPSVGTNTTATRLSSILNTAMKILEDADGLFDPEPFGGEHGWAAHDIVAASSFTNDMESGF
ncbi:hypothetical protein SEMRO_622_G176960.1 [Seminavis robusta]|uniref:Uncharacterized protein n=1 Tax=Seminavis robusta TaxID=568900 RepID=A0A9N8E3P8_9STRA|nr:hypothetical protein SEMRO_622_G176960.1 [Seminavis robusta]|eukprot:Sro622_g176960.1 n/a (149) ;mRNA; r:27087-27533